MKVTTTKQILVGVLLLWVLPATALAQAKPAAPSGTIACKAMEVAASTRFGVRLVIFHYRDARDRERLGELLRQYDGANVKFQAGNGPWSAATVVRLKTCFGRGLLVYGNNEPVIADGNDFLLSFPASPAKAAALFSPEVHAAERNDDRKRCPAWTASETGMKRIRKAPSPLQKKSRRGFRGYPVATIAYYGPDDRHATKVAVGIVKEEDGDADILRRWFSDEGEDIREDRPVHYEILSFIETHGANSVVIADRIIGCPHEEGIDYPEGQYCPMCPFWVGRNRWSGEVIH